LHLAQNLFGLAGGGGLITEIHLKPDLSSIANGDVLQLDHMPSWKVRKNPFTRNSHNSTIDPSGDSSDEPVYAYNEMQNIEGEVVLWLPPGKSLEHNGIKVQLLGRIDLVRTYLSLPHNYFKSFVPTNRCLILYCICLCLLH
jgi:hypothetical protein